jgi:hypothetical protein
VAGIAIDGTKEKFGQSIGTGRLKLAVLNFREEV